MADKLVQVENFINGCFQNSTTTIPSYNPATGKIWARIPDSSPEVVDQAVKVLNAMDYFSSVNHTPT